jgi:hypothetical protein
VVLLFTAKSNPELICNMPVVTVMSSQVKLSPICTVPVKPFRVTVATLAGVFVSAPPGVGDKLSNKASSVPSGYPLPPSSVPLTRSQFPESCQSVPDAEYRNVAWAKAVVEQSIQQKTSSSVERVVFRRINYGDMVLLFVKLFYFWYYAFGVLCSRLGIDLSVLFVFLRVMGLK